MFITSLGNFIRGLLRCSFHLQSNIKYNIYIYMLQLMTVHAMKQVTTISQYLLMDVKALLNVPPSFQPRHKTVQKVYCSMLLSAVVITLIWWAARLIVRELQHHNTNNDNTKEYVYSWYCLCSIKCDDSIWFYRLDLVLSYHDFKCWYFWSTFKVMENDLKKSRKWCSFTIKVKMQCTMYMISRALLAFHWQVYHI